MEENNIKVVYKNGQWLIDGKPINQWNGGRVLTNTPENTWETVNTDAIKDVSSLKDFAQEDPNIGKSKASYGIKITSIKRPNNYNQIMKPVRRSRGGRVFGLNHFVFDPENAIKTTENYSEKLFGNSSVIEYIDTFFTELHKSEEARESNVLKRGDSDEFKRRSVTKSGDVNSWNIERDIRNNQYEGLTYESLSRAILEGNTIDTLDDFGYVEKETKNDSINLEHIGLDDLQGLQAEAAQKFIEYLNVTLAAATRLIQANVGESYNVQSLINIEGAFSLLEKSNENIEEDFKKIFKLLSDNMRKIFTSKDVAKYNCSQMLNTRMDKLRESVNTFMLSELERQASTPDSNTKIGKAGTMHSRKIRVNLPKLKQLWAQTYNVLEQDQPEFLREFTAGETMNYFKEVMITLVPEIWAAIIVMIKTLDPGYIKSNSLKANRSTFDRMLDDIQEKRPNFRISYEDATRDWSNFVDRYNRIISK